MSGADIEPRGSGYFPEVPAAVTLDITWVAGYPITWVYKDKDGNTLKTKTLTWAGDDLTKIEWS